jgi:hypothetical protein
MSLAVSFSEIQEAVGRLLGWGRTPADWASDERKLLDIAAIIREGERTFYYYTPPPLIRNDVTVREGERYSWSFLRPVYTLAITASTAAYDLPANFSELIDGSVSLASGGGKLSRSSEAHIRALPAKSGTPLYYGLRPKAIAEGGQTTWQIVFYPTPNEDTSATLRYSVVPPELSNDTPYPLGGAIHGQCLLEACLAAAERTMNDEEGIHAKRFLECVATSIRIDKEIDTPSDDGIWPLEHPADGLHVTKAYLKRLIGLEMKYGPHPQLWTHKQAQEVQVALETGLRKMYSPVTLPGEKYPYHWSYLRPVHPLTTVEDQSAYDLPDDFQMLDGPLTHASDGNALYPEIKIVGEHQIRLGRQSDLSTGRPRMACVRVKPIDPSGVTRWEIEFWPTPDGAYNLRCPYQINAGAIPEDANLPFGGLPHAQTAIEACLAAAEERMSVGNGMHQQKFLEELVRSVGHDRQVSSPKSLGRSRAQDEVADGNWRDGGEVIHSYNGTFWLWAGVAALLSLI